MSSEAGASLGPIDPESEKKLKNFWDERIKDIDKGSVNEYRTVTKQLGLPLARIKKIMKIDENAKNQMISSEAPILLSKAAEFLIEEMTLRAWINTEQNRRKTIQKSDIAQAVSGVEMFDFLIDIIPREETTKKCPQNPQSHQQNQQHQQQQMMRHQQVNNLVMNAQQLQYVPMDSQQYAMSMPLGNGQYIHATQIGPSIPVSAAAGQPIQVVMMDGNDQFQIVPVTSNSVVQLDDHLNSG